MESYVVNVNRVFLLIVCLVQYARLCRVIRLLDARVIYLKTHSAFANFMHI